MEMGKKTHEARRADSAHDAETDLRFLQAEKPLGRRFGCIGIGIELAQMRLDQPAKIGQMRQFALAPQQQSAELLFELLDGARQRRLRDVALFGRAREVQRVGDRQKIADLVHLHQMTVPAFAFRRKVRPRLGALGAHRRHASNRSETGISPGCAGSLHPSRRNRGQCDGRVDRAFCKSGDCLCFGRHTVGRLTPRRWATRCAGPRSAEASTMRARSTCFCGRLRSPTIACSRWQQRFAEAGVDGLLRDKTRKPGKAPIPAETTARVVGLTCTQPFPVGGADDHTYCLSHRPSIAHPETFVNLLNASVH